MNKAIIFGVIGFCAGGGIGYFASMKRFEYKYAQIANEEIASVKEVYDSKMEKMMKYYPDPKSTKAETNSKSKKDDVKPSNCDLVRPGVRMNSYERAKMDYHLINNQQEEYEDPDDNEEDENSEELDAAGMSAEESERASEVVEGDPYLIDSDEFSEDHLGFDKVSLYYYRVDDVLCSEDNEDIITEIEETVGYDALCKLDTQTMVWVRNERLHIEYEIIAVNSAYSDEVGRATSPRERYNKAKRRDENE